MLFAFRLLLDLLINLRVVLDACSLMVASYSDCFGTLLVFVLSIVFGCIDCYLLVRLVCLVICLVYCVLGLRLRLVVV